MVNILLIDDGFEKLQKISEIICSSGVKSNLEHTTNTIEARKKLRSEFFDIVIVDLNIKPDAISPAAIDDGLSFIDLVFNDRKCILPKEFFFLTEFDEQDNNGLKQRVAERYSKLWFFRKDYNEWMLYFSSRMKFYQEFNDRNYFDVILITALEEEFIGLKSQLTAIQWSKVERKNHISRVIGYYKKDNKQIRCLLISPFAKGMSSLSAVASKVFEIHKPKAAFLLGLCAGTNPEKQEFGDTLVPSFIWDYHSGKIVDGGVFLNAPYQTKASDNIYDLIVNEFHDDSNRFKSFVKNNFNQLNLKNNWTISIGPTVSGGTVIADQEMVKHINSQHKDIIGIDMEGYGFYEALRFHPEVSGCMIKSISDFGDQQKNDNYRELALATTSKVLWDILKSDDFIEIIFNT